MLAFALAGCLATPGPGQHPRLLVTRQDLADLRERVKREPLASVVRQLKDQADALSREESSAQAKVGDIPTVRTFQRRIWLFAATYLATGDERYARRAYHEIASLGSLPSCMDPRHASHTKGADLATAEACAAVGIGYDWTYAALTEQEREAARSILIEKGLRMYVSAVEAEAWWAQVYHNWNPVTNGGCGVGTLAVLGEEEIAGQALSYARSNIRKFWDAVPADGGWDEGLGYWQYAMRYGLLFAAALRSVTGSDDGVFSRPALRHTGYFPVVFTAPDGRGVNFCDDGGGVPADSLFYLLAREYRDSAFYWQKRTYGKRVEPLDLIWMPVGLADFDPSAIPRAKVFHSIGWAALRANPAQPQNDIYLAFKSGNLAANHSHLDLNSFLLVAYGERLLIDPGAGAYVEGYFGPKRWEFYHPSTRAHNTILVNGQGQQPKSKGEIAVFEERQGYDYLLGRAGSAYGDALSRFDRHVLFLDRRYFMIFDDLKATAPSRFDLLLHTKGRVSFSGRSVTITGNKAALDVEVVSPSQFSYSTEEGPDTAVHIASAGSHTSQQFLIVLYPRRLGEPGASVSAIGKRMGVTVTLPSGRSDAIFFERQADGWRPRVAIGAVEHGASAQGAAKQ